MKHTSIFKNGKSSQAVRIPKEYRFQTKECWIKKVGDSLVLTPKPDSWEDFFNSPLKLSGDFSFDRKQQVPQERKPFRT
jgi:antitoxin VapB